MFATKQQGFLGVMTMATAAGVLRVQSPFSAIPPTFPSGTGLELVPLPVSGVNARLMNCDSAAGAAGTDTQTTHEQSQTITDHEGVNVNVLSSHPTVLLH
jgi:hypothetical protein